MRYARAQQRGGYRSTKPGFVLGVGLGGLADGILFHEIAQWHQMGSGIAPPVSMEAMRDNMRWDGFFHLGVWLLVFAGIVWLLGDARRGALLPSPGAFAGQIFLGWGVFNLIEGIIVHHLLGLHHVRDIPVHVPAYDGIFLGIGGVFFIMVGWLSMRSQP